MEMDNVTFGVTMLVAGMGGTLVTLGLLSLMMLGWASSSLTRKRREGGLIPCWKQSLPGWRTGHRL